MFKIIDAIEEWFLALSLGFMLLLNFSNVVSRYFLSMSWSFTEEITTNLFVWSCFLGAAAAAKRNSHLGLSLVTDMLSPKFQRWVGILVTGMSCLMFGGDYRDRCRDGSVANGQRTNDASAWHARMDDGNSYSCRSYLLLYPLRPSRLDRLAEGR